MSERVRKKTAADIARCKKCQHRSMFGGFCRVEIGCLYILDTGKPRGCDFGVNCNKFKEGPCLRRMTGGVYEIEEGEE